MREWEGVGGGGGGRGDFRQQTEQSRPQVVLRERGTEETATRKNRRVPVITLSWFRPHLSDHSQAVSASGLCLTSKLQKYRNPQRSFM